MDRRFSEEKFSEVSRWPENTRPPWRQMIRWSFRKSSIIDPETRLLAEIHLAAQSDAVSDMAIVLPATNRLSRLVELVPHVHPKTHEVRLAAATFFAAEPRAAGHIADEYLVALQLDRLTEIFRSSDKYAWEDLADIAREAGNPELAAKFAKRAHSSANDP
ncbi:MAG: hypothetical protein AAF357_05080 [Verrucomicrobiota bacterium]